MTTESVNHKNYGKKEEELPVAIEVENVGGKPMPILDEKPEVVEEEVFDATDVNKDGKTDLNDAIDVVRKVWAKPKKKKSKRR